MKLFEVMKRAEKVEKESTIKGDIRHHEVDERLLALEANQQFILDHLKLKPVKPIVGKYVDI